MIRKNNTPTNKQALFGVSALTIWSSAIFMGVLASLPKILQLNTPFTELLVDSIIAFVFSLFIWYYNIYSLPKYANRELNVKFFNTKLLKSLLLGVVFMLLLVGAHHLIYPNYNFGAMAFMYEFRGILINLTIYMFLYLLYQSYQTQLMAVELQRVKADHLSAQYELLKQQVNPHFLFNSLTTLKSLIEMGDSHAVDFILHLSDFYRFSLENRKQDIIPLQEELKILHAYMFLLRTRFESGIHLVTEIKEADERSYIPSLTLQLLVENCIKHNVISLERPLVIKLYVEDDMLVLENRLQPKKVPVVSTGMGLENINERYIHLTQKKIEIIKENNLFKVKLPMIHEYSHN